jgi:hypothetical protein
MPGPTASSPIDVCGVVVATFIGNAPTKKNTGSAPSCCNCSLVEGENLIQRHIEDAAMRKRNTKEKSTRTIQGILREEILL